MTELRVATAGTGYFSRFHYEAWTRMDGASLVALYNRDSENGQRAAAEWSVPAAHADFDEMLVQEQPDLVDIITPPATHLGFIRAAAARGIPMVCQKPFCRDLEEAQEAVRIAEAAGVPLVVHENFRFQPWYGEARRLLEAGALGDPYQVTFRLRPGDGQGPEAYLDRQPYFQTMERFLVHETAVHLIDVFRYLMGEATAVFAQLRRLNPAIAGEDAGIIHLDFASGARGLFDGNRLADHAASNPRLTMGEMLLEGSAATLRLDGDGRLWLRRRGETDETLVDYDWSTAGFGGDCVYRLQHHLVDHLTSGGPVMNTAREYLTNLKIEAAVYESDAAGRVVKLTD
jgi:predicted dehydrogenase